MADLLFWIAIIFLPIAAALFWLYRLVKRHQHPDRKTWKSFAQAFTLTVITALVVTAIAITPLAMLLGETLAAKTAVWIFFASLAAAWGLVRKYIQEPPQKSGRSTGSETALETRQLRQNPTAVSRGLPIMDMVIPVTTAVAISSFFFIHDYNPKLGLLYAAQKGEIYLTDPERAKSNAPDFSSEGSLVQAAPNAAPASAQTNEPLAEPVPDNGIKLPYRDVLAVCLVIAGISAGLRRGKRPLPDSKPS